MMARLPRFWLLVRILVRGLWRGPATHAPQDPKTILVVLTGKLGDMVCGTPVLRALRSRYPSARLVAAGGKPLKAVLAGSGLADSCIEWEEGGAEQKIKDVGADAAFILGPSFTPAAWCYLSGIPLVVVPRVIGHSPSVTRPYRLLARVLRTFPYRTDAYAPRERLRALEALGIVDDDTRKHLGYSEAARARIAAWYEEHGIDLAKEKIVGISPAAGNTIKEWPVERFAAVADHLSVRGARVFILGSKADTELVARMQSIMKESAVVVTGFSIDELKALIATLSLYIAVDTGPIYIAEAFGVPTIDIVGPVDERVQPPRGEKHKALVPSRVKAQLSILNAREYDKAEALRQAHATSVEEVCVAARELLSLSHD